MTICCFWTNLKKESDKEIHDRHTKKNETKFDGGGWFQLAVKNKNM